MFLYLILIYQTPFDGDAMLCIFPLGIMAKNEVANVSSVKNWVINYKSSSAHIGLFQDSLIGAAEYTKAGVKLNKWHAMQAFANINTTTERNISFDKQMYSSRDIISKILPPINLTGKKPKIYKEAYAPHIHYNPEDIKVEIDRGKLISGVLDKATVGQTTEGTIFHIINNEFGPDKCMETIYALQQCINNFQLYKGFTVSIRDMRISPETTEKVAEKTAKIIEDSRKVTEKLNKRKLYAPIGRTLDSFYEELQLFALEPGDDFVVPILEDIDFDSNGLVKLVFTGSKGKEGNVISIHAALGQQTVNGYRPPRSFGYNRTSPYYTRYDTEPKANGYIGQSFKEGIPSETFLFSAQESRHGIINNALSTSITGEQNRHAIKNLETLITGCMREVKRHDDIIQVLYSDTGFDPRRLIRVKFPTVLIEEKNFNDQYKASLKHMPSKFKNKSVEELLDVEWKQLTQDRAEYRRIYMNVEQYDFSYLFENSWKSPVNIYKIIEDVKYNYREMLSQPKSSGGLLINERLDPIKTLAKITELCNVLPYTYMNEIQEKKRTPIPEHFIASTKLLNILIRSHLCIRNLIDNRITDDLLNIIIDHIKNTFSRALVDYGLSCGIIAAQCISEPMTQYVLDSKHRSGVGGGSKTNVVVRVKEVLGAKPTDKMKNPTMTLRIMEELENNKAAVQEIANQIEMLPLKRFISKSQIFFEEYGNPVHPEYKHEKDIIKNFEKRHRGIIIPGDLINWCVRFELDKEQMIFKSMKLDDIILALKKKYKELFVVFTPENVPTIVLRCYIRSSLFRKSKTVKTGEDEIQFMIKYMKKIADTLIRGISDVTTAEVIEYRKSTVNDKGAVVTTKVYGIDTNGSNFKDIVAVEGLDLSRCITDSILEISEILGVESGRSSIINELRRAMQGISAIHCTVYADEMTSPGIISSIQRTGISIRDNTNIMLRSSFQYPVQTIEDAAENGLFNKIYGVSSPLCVGVPPKIGTTYSRVIVNQDFIEENSRTLDQKLNDL